MPTIVENEEKWNQLYHWDSGGDIWSKPWGTAGDQWFGCIYPRIRRFLPAESILELAPGFGRWTAYLLDHCDDLVGVDLAERCVEACRTRFASHASARFVKNDGRSLSAVPDSSIDFAFSFDSLVHAEPDTLAAYINELARVLKPNGVAFLHHSNFGAYQRSNRLLAPMTTASLRLPLTVQGALRRTGLYRDPLWRAPTMTASRVADLCAEAGISCPAQELVNWAGGPVLMDAFSVIVRRRAASGEPRVLKNPLFRLEALNIRRRSAIYDEVGGISDPTTISIDEG